MQFLIFSAHSGLYLKIRSQFKEQVLVIIVIVIPKVESYQRLKNGS